MVDTVAARRLSCPQCKNVVTVAPGTNPACDACGYGTRRTAPAGMPAMTPQAAPYGTPQPVGYGGGQGGGYSQPMQQATPVYVANQPLASGMGTASMVFGILAIVFGLLPALIFPLLGLFNLWALLAVIFGGVQLKRVKRAPTQYGGAGAAKAGLIMGLIIYGLGALGFLATVIFVGASIAGA